MSQFASFILLLIVSALSRGFVFQRLWIWFFVPTFAAPMVTIPTALGISALVAMLTFHAKHTDNQKSFSDFLTDAWVNVLFLPWFTLLMAWIYRQFA